MMLSQEAGQQQWATAPSQPSDHEGKHRYTYNHAAPIQPVQLYSIQLITWDIQYFCKIVFVLSDFAQMCANVSVLSTLEVRLC